MSIREFFSKRTGKFQITVLVLVILFFIVENQVTHLRPDHAFLALLIVILAFGKERSRQFLIDWSPFVVFWIAYDMMRGVADNLLGYVHTFTPFRMEQLLFYPILHGDILPFILQNWQKATSLHALAHLLNVISANFYTFHFAVPIVIGWIFWHTTNDRKMFYRFAYTLTTLNFMALATFMLFPTAPPWYVMHYGFAQPQHTSFFGLSAGSLVDLDKLLGGHTFATIWDSFNPNHFAAVPSLHGAYPIAAITFLYLKFRKYLGWMLLYPLGTWFAAVYLNQHYVVDLIIGGIYLWAAFQMEEKILYPKLFARFLEKEESVESPKKVHEGTAISNQ